MSAYLIEVQDSEGGVIHPTIIGPFDDGNKAVAFRRRWFSDSIDGPPNGEGGYYAVHIVSDERCDYSPEAYAETYAWKREDLEDDE